MRFRVFLLALLVPAILSCNGNESATQTRAAQGNSVAYTIKCGYLAQPETVFPLVQKTAEFWKKAHDPANGGFFTFVNNDGTPVADNTMKTILSQSRDAFGFSRAWMMTGDASYLDYGNRALEFLARSGWDETNGGFFTCLSQGGEPVDFQVSYDRIREKWSFMQHYALLGIAAMYDADRAKGNLDFLTTARKVLDTKLWDSRPGMEGYFETADYNWANPRGKGFTPTVDGITTHGLSLYLLTGKDIYRKRLLELADTIVARLIPAMADRKIGFPESFTTDWKPTDDSFCFIGHVLKTAWCLGRAYLVDPKPEYIAAAEKLTAHVMATGWDSEHGAPFTHADGVRGIITNRNKDWWTVEQAITCGLVMYHITGKPEYLKMADEALYFFTTYMFDHENGEAFASVQSDGSPFGRLPLKGDYWKAGYHTMETFWFVYLYGNLYVHKKPVTLHYRIPTEPTAREIRLSPVEIEEGRLKIDFVLRDGKVFTGFDAASRTLKLPAATGGDFTVTFSVR